MWSSSVSPRTNPIYRLRSGCRPNRLNSLPRPRTVRICTLNYTSGTTGQPKGIPHAHKDMPISSQLYTVNKLGLSENDRTFSVARLFFTFGLGVNLFSPWYVDASTVLCSKPPRVAANIL